MRYYFPSMPNRIDIESRQFTQTENDPQWIAEVKKNGWRCLAYRTNKLILWTRRHTTIPDALPLLRAELFSMIPENTVIDGELLEKRTKEVKELFYAFDILVYRNVPLFKHTWRERRLILESVIQPIRGMVELSDPQTHDKRALYFDNITNPDVEGLVIKKAESPYLYGLTDCPKNPFWMKVKRPEKSQYQVR